ncbi:unnamed protein product [Durusdinium trenchii]|uniref:Uncharacterized protein n=1 Tax=Durusdinium trenchii TaxID=1381693 RepID=A0ABP0KU97_9DINO
MPDVLSSPDIGEVENIISSVAQKCPQEADVLGGSPVVDLSEVENIISDAVKQHSQELHDVSRAEAEPVMSQTTFVTDPTSVPQAGTPVREGGRVSDPNASAASAALKGENQQLRLEVGRLQRVCVMCHLPLVRALQ